MIDDHKGEWEIQLSMRMIFVSFTDVNETRDIYSKSDNITILRGIEINDVINELLILFIEDIRKNYKKNEGKQLYI